MRYWYTLPMICTNGHGVFPILMSPVYLALYHPSYINSMHNTYVGRWPGSQTRWDPDNDTEEICICFLWCKDSSWDGALDKTLVQVWWFEVLLKRIKGLRQHACAFFTPIHPWVSVFLFIVRTLGSTVIAVTSTRWFIGKECTDMF